MIGMRVGVAKAEAIAAIVLAAIAVPPISESIFSVSYVCIDIVRHRF